MAQGMDDAVADFQFKVNPEEQRIIELNAPASVLLLGRSGTGKTTCAVFRMWARWLLLRHRSSEPFHQVTFIPCQNSNRPIAPLRASATMTYPMLELKQLASAPKGAWNSSPCGCTMLVQHKMFAEAAQKKC